MPVNQFNIGKDFVIDLTTQLGVQSFIIATEFQSKQNTHSINSMAMDGIMRFAELPAGWEGTLKFDRASPAIDQFFATLEANYYGGIPITAASITETAVEVDGSITQWLYYGVAFKYDDAGSKSGDKKVEQTISFKASGRNRLT